MPEQEELRQICEDFDELCQRRFREDNWREYRDTALAVVRDHGDMSPISGQSCHIQLLQNTLLKNSQFVLSHINNDQNQCHKKPSVEEKRFYLDYLANRSPLADAFALKDADLMLEFKCGIIHSQGVPGTHSGMALFAFRHLWEFAQTSVVFKALVEAGTQEDLALLFTQLFHHNEWDKYSIYVGSMGHCIMSPSDTSFQFLSNFIKRNIIGGTKELARSLDYRGVKKLYDNGRKQELLVDHFRTHYKADPTDDYGAATNPFFSTWEKKRLESQSINPSPEPFTDCIKHVRDYSKVVMNKITEESPDEQQAVSVSSRS